MGCGAMLLMLGVPTNRCGCVTSSTLDKHGITLVVTVVTVVIGIKVGCIVHVRVLVLGIASNRL